MMARPTPSDPDGDRDPDPDKHVFEIYFTAPGKPEVLADRMVFTPIR